ncbi:MAG: T9SS type A sorting domain-containing protein, partial [Flavobacteriales bacterium]
ELDAEVLIYYVLQDFTFGIFYMASDGSYTFTPSPDVTGTFTVTYYGCDPCSICDEGTLTILVVTDKDANTAPAALPFESSICEGDYVEINMNDIVQDMQTTDADLAYAFEGVNTGLISFDASTHVLTYQSMPGVLGSAVIPYTVCDNSLVTLCTSDTLRVYLNDHLPLHIQSAMVISPTCYGAMDGEIIIESLNVDGNLNYTWSTTETTNSISQLGAGNYALEVQSDLACAVALDTTFVLINPEILEITDITLTGITATANGSMVPIIQGGQPPYAYLWTSPSGNASTNAELMNLTEPGVYSLQVTDANGCTDQASTTLTSLDEDAASQPVVYWSEIQDALFIQGCETGSIRLFNSSGSLCFEQTLNAGKNIRVNGLAAGMYHWQITNDQTIWNGRFMKQ